MVLGLSILLAIVSLGFALAITRAGVHIGVEEERAEQISRAMEKGTMAFLARHCAILVGLAFLVFLAIIGFSLFTKGLSFLTGISFLVGVSLTTLACLIGMRAAGNFAVGTALEAKKGIILAFRHAFSSGSVLGLTVVGLGVLGISALFFLLTRGNSALLADALTRDMLGICLGASLVALFSRVGGGIFNGAVHFGKVLLRKAKPGIVLDDVKSPVAVAEKVGVNFSGVFASGADLMESYFGSVIASMLLGYLAMRNAESVLFPLITACVGLPSAIIGILFTKSIAGRSPYNALRNGTIFSALFMTMAIFLARLLLKNIPTGLVISVLTGLVAGLLVCFFTEYYTSTEFSPTRALSRVSLSGYSATILGGLALGAISTVLPLLTIVSAIVLGFAFAGGFSEPVKGLFGVSLSAVGMLSTLGISLAVGAYGPVARNARGIAEMVGLGEDATSAMDSLDAVGSTTSAIFKGFTMSAAGLTTLTFLSAFISKAQITALDISQPAVIAGLLVGGVLPFFFVSLVISGIGIVARDMQEEVSRQYREIPGLLEGKAQGNYAHCVDVMTLSAFRRTIAPALLAVLSPFFLGLAFSYLGGFSELPNFPGGPEAVGGMLVGALASGLMIAFLMANWGVAWENLARLEVKRSGSEKHVSPTTGEEFSAHSDIGVELSISLKDACAVSLNSLLKFMAIISLVFVVYFM